MKAHVPYEQVRAVGYVEAIAYPSACRYSVYRNGNRTDHSRSISC